MVKLKSEFLIEYYGKDEITDEELEQLHELSIYNINSVKPEDLENFHEDLIEIIKQGENINDIDLGDASSEMLPIKEMLKNTKTDNIKFGDSEKIFDQMKEDKIDLDEITKKGFRINRDITEYDMFDLMCICKGFDSEPLVDAKDLDKALKYIDIDKIRVHIKTQEDLDLVNKLAEGKEVKIDIDLFDLKNVNGIEKDKSRPLYLNVSNVAELSRYELEKLAETHDIKEIYAGGDYETENSVEKKEVVYSEDFEHYDVDTYKRIYSELEKVVEGINKDEPELSKFLKVYERLGKKIEYDHDRMDLGEGLDGNVYLGGLPEIHSLTGGLFNNKAVCEGYSKILHQALNMVGIDSKLVTGNRKEHTGHAWNQIKIDGKWYNTDLTWDAENIRHGRELDYCLQSDEDFISHTPDSYLNTEECLETISPDLVNDKMGIQKPVTLEDRPYTSDEAINTIKSIGSYNELGTRTSIQKDLDNGGYVLMVAKLTEEKYEWMDGIIRLGDIENVSDFISKYSKEYSVSTIDHAGVVDFISSMEGVDLIIDDEIKNLSKQRGVDCDELLKTSQQKAILKQKEMDRQQEASEISQEEYEEKIEERFEEKQEEQQDLMEEKAKDDIENKIIHEPKALKVYKPSVWTRIASSFRNGFNSFKERFNFFKREQKELDKIDQENEIKEEEQQQAINEEIHDEIDQNFAYNSEKEIKETLENKKSKYPSWDLRNWTQEQLEQAKEEARKAKQQREMLRDSEDKDNTSER